MKCAALIFLCLPVALKLGGLHALLVWHQIITFDDLIPLPHACPCLCIQREAMCTQRLAWWGKEWMRQTKTPHQQNNSEKQESWSDTIHTDQARVGWALSLSASHLSQSGHWRGPDQSHPQKHQCINPKTNPFWFRNKDILILISYHTHTLKFPSTTIFPNLLPIPALCLLLFLIKQSSTDESLNCFLSPRATRKQNSSLKRWGKQAGSGAGAETGVCCWLWDTTLKLL